MIKFVLLTLTHAAILLDAYLTDLGDSLSRSFDQLVVSTDFFLTDQPIDEVASRQAMTGKCTVKDGPFCFLSEKADIVYVVQKINQFSEL